MLSRQFVCLKIFVTSLALASHGQYHDTGNNGLNAAIQVSGNNEWQSGDCINNWPSSIEKNFPLNKPSTCITWCKANGLKYAGLKNTECTCGDKVPQESPEIARNPCYTTCPGQSDSKCGGGNQWRNVFSTDGKIIKFHVYHNLIF